MYDKLLRDFKRGSFKEKKSFGMLTKINLEI